MSFRAATLGKLLILVCVALVLVPAGSGANVPLPKRITQALAVPDVSARTEGVIVVDLQNGKTVFARNAAKPLAPASNEKLAVTFAALKALGPAYEFRTEVLGEGWQEGTVWHGSIVLKGFGDPALDVSIWHGWRTSSPAPASSA